MATPPFQLLVINRAAFFEVFVGADGRTDTASLMKFITHMQKVPNKKWLQNKVDARKSWQAFKKSVLHDFLEGEEMTLLTGDDGNYYTVQDRTEPYGDYAETEFQWYGVFSDSELVKQHIQS